MTRPQMPNEYPSTTFEVDVPEAAPSSLLRALDAIDVAYDVSAEERASHGRDWWPLSIRDVTMGHVPHWPGVVVRPRSTLDVSNVVKVASEHQMPLTAQGGRSGVVGGGVAPTGAISLDLTGLDQVLSLDTTSGTVRVQAGVFGPDLEDHVGAHGWTVGHFPQSFDLATVGGWIACRGAGQYSNRYGKIEDMVRALTVVLANGDVVQLGGLAPRQAVGPDLLQLFVGSEGTLGVITEATLVVHPKPTYERRAAYGFDSFEEGLDACRRIMQRASRPAVLRLYDHAESERSFGVESCALIVLDEGDPLLVDATMSIVLEECFQASKLDVALVERWMSHRNDVSALASLWEHGIVVDTIEVSGSWAILSSMRRHVVGALEAIEDMLVVSAHQSHAYSDGACLYFTFAGRPSGDPTAFYRRAWDEASHAVLASGGALSHHHGVGRNRARFVPAALASAYPLLVALKAQLDPLNLLNPGALGIGAEPW
ncbi:MAG: FAD-binding oxidoreductase [Acidimicrobiales bacterium]